MRPRVLRAAVLPVLLACAAALAAPQTAAAQRAAAQTAAAQTAPYNGPGQPHAVGTPAQQMLRLFELRDNEAPVELGEALVASFPDDATLSALHVIGLINCPCGTVERGRALSAQNLARWPDHAWTHAAHAVATANAGQARASETVTAAARARELAPYDAEVAGFVARALATRGQHRAVVALADTFAAVGMHVPELLAARALALARLAGTGRARDTAAYRAALDAFSTLRDQSPDFVAAWQLHGNLLVADGRADEALPLLRRAVELSPRSVPVRRSWWSGLDASSSSREERRTLIEADVLEFLELMDFRPFVLERAVAQLELIQAEAAAVRLLESAVRDRAGTAAADVLEPHLGRVLVAARRFREALPLLERAATTGTMTDPLRRAYWRAIAGQTDMSAADKHERIVGDMEALLAERAYSLETMAFVATHLAEDMSMSVPERLLPLWDRLIEGHANGPDGARYELQRAWLIRDSAGLQGADSAAAEARFRAGLRAVLSHGGAAPGVLEQAAEALISALTDDPSADAEQLWAAWQELEPYVGTRTKHIVLPLALAARGGRLHEAETLARDGLDAFEDELEPQRQMLSVPEYAKRYDEIQADVYDTVGEVLLHAGRLSASKAELERAWSAARRATGTGRPDLDWYRTFSISDNLGRLAGIIGDTTEAARWYAVGSGAGRAKSTLALQQIYRARHGGLEGFGDWIDGIVERSAAERLAAQRITDPRPLPEFRLEWLHGGEFDSALLRGRIAVINFWGVWCGYCREEAPLIQQFSELYRDHPDVVFLTIANDKDPDLTRRWMSERGYTFPVLVDETVGSRAGIPGYPATLFVDRDGFVVYQMGFTPLLIEEYTRRINALLES